MERNSMSNNFKDHIFDGKTIISNNNKPIKSPWESSNRSSTYGEDYTCGFSWPPRSYICSFCKREFRSAQALGGHMNVHRRDRARLRQYSPPTPTVMVDGQYSHIPSLNLNSNPNCNPNFSSSSSASSTSRLPPCTCTLPSLVSPNSLSSSSSASPNEMKKWGNEDAPLLVPSSPPSGLFLSSKMKTTKSLFRAKEFDLFTQEDEWKFSTKGEINVRLDLGIGFLPDSKEDVDLELRLGYS